MYFQDGSRFSPLSTLFHFQKYYSLCTNLLMLTRPSYTSTLKSNNYIQNITFWPKGWTLYYLPVTSCIPQIEGNPQESYFLTSSPEFMSLWFLFPILHPCHVYWAISSTELQFPPGYAPSRVTEWTTLLSPSHVSLRSGTIFVSPFFHLLWEL